jgi:hypothetical protein
VLGGGGRFESSGQSGAAMTMSMPLSDSEQGWTVAFANGTASQTGHARAFAICAQVNG